MTAIVLTHGRNDHITAARVLRAATGAPIWFHPADRMARDAVHPAGSPDGDLAEGVEFAVAETALRALHPRARTAQHLPTCAGPRHRLHRRHRVPGRSWRDRPNIG